MIKRFDFIRFHEVFNINGFPCELTHMKCMDAYSAPEPRGHYCTAIRVNNTLYLSGVIGIDKETNKLADGGIKHETEVIFKNIKNILNECGLSFQNVATVKIYLDDLDNMKAVNDLYGTYFLHPYPARTLVEVPKLPEVRQGAKIEVELMAVIGDDQGRFADPPTDPPGFTFEI